MQGWLWLFLLIGLPSGSTWSLLHRPRHHYVSTKLAPLQGFDSRGAIEGEYIVHLQKGCTLNEHFESTGKNFTGQEGFRRHDWLPGYVARFDIDTLHNNIRKDITVHLVENNRRVHLIQPVYIEGYTAPLHHCEGDVVPDSYAVSLFPGVSLEQHKATVGREAKLESGINGIVDDWRSDQIIYTVKLDHPALAAVRADAGVKLVECNGRANTEGGS